MIVNHLCEGGKKTLGHNEKVFMGFYSGITKKKVLLKEKVCLLFSFV